MAMPPRYMPETSSGIRGLRAARQEGPPPPPPPPPPPSLTPPSSVAGQFLPDMDIVPNKVSLSPPPHTHTLSLSLSLSRGAQRTLGEGNVCVGGDLLPFSLHRNGGRSNRGLEYTWKPGLACRGAERCDVMCR